MSTATAFLELTSRMLHAAGNRQGVARCGAVMRDPWTAGRSDVLAGRAINICLECWPECAFLFQRGNEHS